MITRDEWSGSRVHCHCCGRAWYQMPYELQTHEIASGPARNKALEEPSTWLRLCGACHANMHDYAIYPIVAQLALKKLRDPEHYDRQRVNELRGRQPDAITEEEVDSFMEGLL